jgi:hypothetical protein
MLSPEAREQGGGKVSWLVMIEPGPGVQRNRSIIENDACLTLVGMKKASLLRQVKHVLETCLRSFTSPYLVL